MVSRRRSICLCFKARQQMGTVCEARGRHGERRTDHRIRFCESADELDSRWKTARLLGEFAADEPRYLLRSRYRGEEADSVFADPGERTIPATFPRRKMDGL